MYSSTESLTSVMYRVHIHVYTVHVYTVHVYTVHCVFGRVSSDARSQSVQRQLGDSESSGCCGTCTCITSMRNDVRYSPKFQWGLDVHASCLMPLRTFFYDTSENGAPDILQTTQYMGMHRSINQSNFVSSSAHSHHIARLTQQSTTVCVKECSPLIVIM